MNAGTDTLPGWLEAHADPQAPAVRTEHACLDYGELLDHVRASAGYLNGLGVARGDRVLLALPNSVEHIVALLAVTSIGAIAVPMDPASGGGRIRRVHERTGPALALTLAPSTMPHDVDFRAIRVQMDERVVRVDGSQPVAALRDAMTRRIDPAETALIRFSSGSTGEPKGVVLSHHQMLWTATTLSRVYSLGAMHRELIIAPMAHSGAWQRVAATLAGGGCVVLADGLLSVTGVLEAIVEHAVTGWFCPPAMVRMLLRAPADRVRAAMAGCRCVEIGSGPVSAAELAAVMDRCPAAAVFFHYGLTECSRAFILDARRYPERLDTVGLPAPEVEADVRDESGHGVPPGTTGEIHLRGPQMAGSYWSDGGEGRQVAAGGWLATGDLGILDHDGFLCIRGRRDDRICCGGHSYFPAEVESELGAVEGVREYLVVGVPDPKGVLGDVPCAFVVPHDPGTWSSREFMATARRTLPAYMVPRRVTAVSELPMTPSGKPDRLRARRMYGAQ